MTSRWPWRDAMLKKYIRMTNHYLRHRVIICNVCFKRDVYYKYLQPYCCGEYSKRKQHNETNSLLITTNNVTPVSHCLPSRTWNLLKYSERLITRIFIHKVLELRRALTRLSNISRRTSGNLWITMFSNIRVNSSGFQARIFLLLYSRVNDGGEYKRGKRDYREFLEFISARINPLDFSKSISEDSLSRTYFSRTTTEYF